ncbi:hypothetical protein HZH66_005318 [Vespula vulgaris]|uniref:Uncharacterized protein n=1 Tax=Vespula vulgaris TaxID=7454 RepID=A0A834KFL6_VESVU|nr:hypothetical protein HZH66_005318 [Vespula vulgaris]
MDDDYEDFNDVEVRPDDLYENYDVHPRIRPVGLSEYRKNAFPGGRSASLIPLVGSRELVEDEDFQASSYATEREERSREEKRREEERRGEEKRRDDVDEDEDEDEDEVELEKYPGVTILVTEINLYHSRKSFRPRTIRPFVRYHH